METKANYVAVGIFTILAVLAAFGFVWWSAGLGEGGETTTLRVRIPGSASGLGRGSAVLFNGVKVGDVRRVYIDVSNPSDAIADAEVDRLTPITRSTAADIGLAGLTGQANIELKGGNPAEPNLLDEAEAADRIAEIVANPSAVTNLLQTAQDIFRRADAVLVQLEGFVGEARGPLTETVRNVEQFSEALGRNAEGIDQFLANFSELSQSLANVSGQLDSTLKAAENILQAVDTAKIGSIVANVETFTETLRDATDEFNTIVAGVDKAVTSIGEFSDNANATLSRVDGMLQGVQPGQIGEAVRNIEAATTTARQIATDVAKVTDRFGNRADDIDQIITDAQTLSDRLAQASTRVDGILVKVDNLLGSGEAEGVMAEAGETLKAFRQVADTLNARMGTITDGLARFSGQGLRDVESLVRDSRRAITRIEQAVTDLERNPQRIITGGSGTVREYDGRVRR